LPGYLAKICTALDKNPRAALAFCDYIRLTEKGETFPERVGHTLSTQDLLLRTWGITTNSVLMSRRVFDLCGGSASN